MSIENIENIEINKIKNVCDLEKFYMKILIKNMNYKNKTNKDIEQKYGCYLRQKLILWS